MRRIRPDVMTVSLGSETIRVLKDEAAMQGTSVSALIRSWAQVLAVSEKARVK